MEDLKQITSTESHEGENISIEEIQKLDKKALGENLANLDNQTKNKLLVGLKTLIQKNIDSGNNQDQSIIYALQIFGNLSGYNMKIDGVYSSELDNPKFKETYIQSTNKPKSIGERLGIDINNFKDAKNLGEFLNITIETLLKKYAQKLNSPEGIPLSTNEIHNELVILLQEIDKNLPNGNIFKGTINTIISNFLTPKENSHKLINSAIEKALNPKEKELNNGDIEVLKITIKGGLGSIIDIAKTQSDDKLKGYINEFKNIPKIKEYIKDIPEFDKIFDLIVSLVKTLDKKELFSAIDSFFEKNSGNLLKIVNKKSGEKIEDKVKLEVINGAWKIVDGLITKERIDIGINNLSQFEFIKNNKIMSQVLDIINNGKLSGDDKYILFKEISKLVSDVTSPDIDKNLQGENIKKSLNSIIELLSKFNKEGKIDEKKVVNLIKDFLNNGEELSIFEKIKRLKNINELGSFLKDNYKSLYKYAIGSLKGEGLEEAIKDFIENYRLSDNITKAGGNLIDRLEKAFNLNTADMILSIKDNFLVGNEKDDSGDKTTSETEEKAAYDIGSIIVNKIGKNGLELLKSKLSSNNTNDKKLTKDDLVDTIFNSLGEIFKDENLKNRIFENAKKLGANIDKKENFIQNMIIHFLNNTEFKNIINKVATNLLSRIGNSKDMGAEIDNIKNDVNKLIGDFSKNYNKEGINGAVRTFNETNILDKNSKTELLNSSISIAYQYLQTPTNINSLLQAFPELANKLPKNIPIEKTISQFLNAIPKDVIFKVLNDEINSGFDIEKFKKPEKILEIFNKILNDPSVNKDMILDNIISLSLKSIPNKDNKKLELNIETLSQGVDAIYNLLGNADSKKIKELAASLGLDDFFGKAIETTLKNIPKNALKETLISNMDILKNPKNTNSILKFASELYEKIPVGNRLNIVSDLVSNIDKTKGENIKLDSENITYLNNLLYSSLETKDMEKTKSIIKTLIPELENILDTKIVGNIDNAELGINILKSIKKEDFKDFLQKNAQDINNFIETKNKDIAIKLSKELFLKIDGNTLGENFKEAGLSQNEKAGIDMIGSMQKSVEKNKSKIDSMIKTGEKIKNHIESKQTDISKSSLTKQELQVFSENLFDIVADIISFELKDIMGKNNLENIDEARKILAEKFEIPSGNGESNIDMSKISIMDFVANNLGFSLSWGISYIFKGKDFTIKNAGIDYFLNSERKGDFSRIVTNYFN